MKDALLASKRRPIELQKVPFWGLTNALMKSNWAFFKNHFCNSLCISKLLKHFGSICFDKIMSFFLLFLS